MIYYLLNVALILAGCLIFYKLLLQKETFFPLNRFILLSCLVLAFSLPFVPVPQQWAFRKADVPIAINQTVPESVKTQQQKNAKPSAVTNYNKIEKESIFKEISILKVLIWAYWLGVIIFGINFLFQLFVLLYRAYSRPVIKDGRFRIVELSGDQAPCSFGNNIFINPEKYDWDTYNQIILHEKIHIQQGHSYDILIAELALVFQWFNPFAWLYRKAMEDNLEFLTDHELLQHSDVERSSYQMSLVKVSAPHFPVSLTTNYNQSILKKRLIMMNAKKSNVNSTWKYLFILPLLLLFVSLFNEPKVYGKENTLTESKSMPKDIATDGSWFAVIKDDKITIRFVADDEENRNNGSSSTFLLSELKNLPKNASGTFSLTRDPGTMNFVGKMEGNTGMGTYKFTSDPSFIDFLTKEGVKNAKEKDALVYYMINMNRSFVSVLKSEGYASLSKEELIPLAALGVDQKFIRSLKDAGLNKLSIQDLISLKALGVDGNYVKEIRDAGYKDVTASKLITFKSQGMTGQFLKDTRNAKAASREMLSSTDDNSKKTTKAKIKPKDQEDDDDDEAFGNLIAKKALNITATYVKGFTDNGIKASDDDIIAMKSLGITPEFFKSFQSAGMPSLSVDNAIALKAIGATANDYNEYKKIGFNSLTIDDLISAKSTGTSPTFIASMIKKGYSYKNIDKYVQMKVLTAN